MVPTTHINTCPHIFACSDRQFKNQCLKSLALIFFPMLNLRFAEDTHIYTLSLAHTHTHTSRSPSNTTDRETNSGSERLQRLFFFKEKKKRGKHQNQPRPEIDEWWQRRWFWQAEWSRSLNGFIQEEIRNTHTHTHTEFEVCIIFPGMIPK